MNWRVAIMVMVFWCAPELSKASVIINEVAWMGTSVSANDEWVELYNSGSETVSVDGWVLEDGAAFSVVLAGSVAAGQYAVLERTDDDSAPGSAFLIYTGALPNTGATLVLKNAQGSIVDQVAGGENWESIGGDNVTKETAQHTPNGWVTAPATAGRQNASESSAQNEEDDEDEAKTKSGSSGKVITRVSEKPPALIPSTNTLQLSIESPRVVYINQPTQFVAKSTNIGETIIESLKYSWNFGDFTTGTGESVTHTYKHAGEYIVSLQAEYARHNEIVRQKVTVLPVRFSITKNLAGDIQIHNDSPYEVDVSGFSLVSDSTLVLPDLSFIPEGGTVTVASTKLGAARSGHIQLRDRSQTLLATYAPGHAHTPEAPLPAVAYIAPQVNVTSAPPPTAFSFSNRDVDVVPEQIESSSSSTRATSSTVQASVISAPEVPANVWPMAGLLGVIALGLLGLYAGASKS